jgi:hypothetical protein
MFSLRASCTIIVFAILNLVKEFNPLKRLDSSLGSDIELLLFWEPVIVCHRASS